MDNYFITRYFDWPAREPGKKAGRINRVLRRLGLRLVPLAGTGVMTNVEQRMNMFHLVDQVLAYGVPGDLVELGCHAGQSAVLIQTVMERYEPARELHLYDSFEGLPETTDKDGQPPVAVGQLKATSRAVYRNFERYGLRRPVVHEGWFDDTLPDGLPEQIAFAHLDGDFYESMRVSLEHVYPRLSPGAVCLVDDYSDPAVSDVYDQFPGVKTACDEFLADKPEAVSVLYAGGYAHGFFRKL